MCVHNPVRMPDASKLFKRKDTPEAKPVTVDSVKPQTSDLAKGNHPQPTPTEAYDCKDGVRASGGKCGGKYSIQFYICDANGKTCNGMYYSIKVIDTKELIVNGITDSEGRTTRVYADSKSKAYLYIGHRIEKFEDLPVSRSTPENQRDECNLNSKGDYYDTMDPHEKMKIVEITTERLWKPWVLSAEGKAQTAGAEKMILNSYSNDGGKPGNVTIGVGHLIHHGLHVMNQSRLDTVIKYLNDKNININKENIINNLESALKLSGLQLSNAKAEMNYINGITKEQGQKIFEQDLIDHQKEINPTINVPLYQYEYDTLADFCFNAGRYRLQRNNSAVGVELNEGRYTCAGESIANRQATDPNRRLMQAGSWNNVYGKGDMMIKDNNSRVNQPPWGHVEFSR